MKARHFAPLAAAACWLGVAGWAQAPAARPEKWAQRVEAEGLSNFHRLVPSVLRSAQPTAEGLRAAEKAGVRTVLSLRADSSDDLLAAGTKLRLVRIPMEIGTPDEDALLRAVAVLANAKDAPVLVHCQLGADRTGAVCALYRILVQNWPREEALHEMRDGGFGFGIVEFARFIAAADLEKLRAAFVEKRAREQAGQ